MHPLRAMYITVVVCCVIIACLFVGSIIFFDRSSRRSYQYDIRRDGTLTGTIRIDRFATEDRTTYKQTTEEPFALLYTGSRIKVVISRNGSLESFSEERTTRDGAEAVTCAENKDGRISYLARAQSRFIYIEAVPVQKNVFVFRPDEPVTYMPLIENYDFEHGRSQSFRALTYQRELLPPAMRHVTFTSIRDEYLKIDGRKIKTECLVLKVKGHPQGRVWVAKSDRKLIRIELPDSGVVITRSFITRSPAPDEMPAETGSYSSREVVFKNGNTLLAGTLTMPPGDGRCPAALLVPGDGPLTRNYLGLFSSIAADLSANGYAVLRYDKRGMGKSAGNSDWPRTDETAGDIRSAIQFLGEQPRIDATRMVIIAHGAGVVPASLAINRGTAVAGAVFISPDLFTITDYDRDAALLAEASCRNGWGREYRDLILMACRDTKRCAEQAKFGWTYLLGRRCFTGDVKDRMALDPLESIRTLATPVLVVQGREDRDCTLESASPLKRALEGAAGQPANLVYFDGFDRFLGRQVNDGIHRLHYAISPEMIQTMRAWMNRTIAAAAKAADEAASSPASVTPETAAPATAQ